MPGAQGGGGMSLEVTETTARCEWPNCRQDAVVNGDKYRAEDELKEAGWVEAGGRLYCPAHADVGRQWVAGQLRWKVGCA